MNIVRINRRNIQRCKFQLWILILKLKIYKYIGCNIYKIKYELSVTTE